MRATDFEYRHSTLIRHLLIAAAVATYLFDRDNVVWRFIKESPSRTQLERAIFLVTTLLIGAGAAIATWSRAKARPQHRQLIGEFVYAVGLATLMPLSGCILLIIGEAVRVLRLAPLVDQRAEQVSAGWGSSFRQEAAKWGLFVTMIAFTITLTDRLAEYLAGASILVWAGLNLPSFNREKSGDPAR